MSIDQSALGEFVSAIRGATQSKTKTNEYLTGVVTKTDLDGTIWVDVAGGVNAMPVTRSTSSYSPGDVVSFTIEDGVASIGGNMTDPAASGTQILHIEKNVEVVETKVEKIGNVVAEKADIADLRAARANISQLQAADVTITGRLNAAEGDITNLKAKDVTIEGKLTAVEGNIGTLQANTADIGTIRANSAKVQNLTAAELEADHAKVGTLDATYATIDSLDAATGRIGTLEANTADIGTIRANSAKVNDVTAQQITAATGYISDLTAGDVTAADILSDHAAVGNLDANYAQIDMANVNNAWISNGTIKDGAISSAMINDLSANKLTAGTINGANINVTNLNADNITTGTINGQRIGEGSLSLDKLSEDVYTESEVDAKLSTMQQQIDGAIETWTGTEVPTLQNAPASSWTTTQLKDQHVGDVYFVVNSQSQQNGYNYRFTKTGSSYSWQLIKDSDVTNALQRIQTAEGKITTFDSDISTLKTDTGELKTKTQSLETSLGDKVDTTTFSELEDTVDGHTWTLQQHTTAISSKADGSTVSALTTRVSKNEQDISGINTTIGTLQTTVESKADGSTVTTISSKLNSVEATVNGHTETISSVQSTLSTKADNSTVQTLRSEYNETKTTVSGHETRLTATESVANGVRADFDNLEIGGRNLLRHTKVSAENKSALSWTLSIEEKDGRTAYKYPSELGPTSWTSNAAWNPDGLDANTYYTYSVWLYFTAEVSFNFISLGHFQVYNGNSEKTDKSHEDVVGARVYSPAVIPANTWTRASIVFKTNELDGSTFRAYPRFNVAANTGDLWFCEQKLEKGNKATDWTPAPEDLETEVTTLKTDYANYKQTTTENLSTLGTTVQGIDGRVTTAESTITQHATDIEAKVSKDGVIAAINLSTETDGGSTAKISADKVQINGTAIFSAIRSDVDSAITSKGYATTGQAVKRTQRIYFRKSASGAPAAPGTAPTNWVTNGNTESSWTKFGTWSTRVPPIADTKDAAASSRYLYLYTCEQREMADGNLAYTTVLLDDSNTIIDGGNIITGTIDANKLNADSINTSHKLTVGSLTIKDAADVLNSELEDHLDSLDYAVSSLQDDMLGYEDENQRHVPGELDNIKGSITGLTSDMNGKVDADAVIDAVNKSTEESGGKTVLISGAKLDIATNASFRGLVEIANAKIDMAQATALFAQMLTAAHIQVGNIESVHIQQRGNRFSFLMPGRSLPNVTDEELDQHSDTAFEGEVAFISVNTDTGTSTFYMNQSVVLNNLRFGDWKWYNRANKHMTLQYVGEVNS